MSARNAVVALTDRRWFDFLRSRAVDGVLDEVNFWRPKAQASFRRLVAGEPFFFRLKSPVNKIAGYGFFALDTMVTVRLAWEAFRERNGDATFEGFVSRIAEYRGQSKGNGRRARAATDRPGTMSSAFGFGRNHESFGLHVP